MGQGYSINSLPAGPSAIEASELSDLTFEKALGGARLLRTVRARHQNGVVVAKVCQKNSPNESFKHYAKALKEERRALRDTPNVLPYQRIRETPTLGLLVRQFIHCSLYDRVSIRPFLEDIEKKWIAFQLLCAVRDCHARGVFHGDIKSENVLVTSWGWVYLTDFAATFKPVYLPEDNPHDFGIFYDTSARRTCYLAPERFYTPADKPIEPHAVQWNMDIFSVGCVLAELFTETPTFSLSQLFRYRKGEYDPVVALLSKVDDENVRSLISSMIRLDPQERWHAQDYLDEHKGRAFPLYFYQHLHTLMQEITDPSSGRKPPTAGNSNNGESDDRIDRVYNDFELLSLSLDYAPAPSVSRSVQPTSGGDLFPLQVDLPNNRHFADASFTNQAANGTFILLNVITASIRSTARAASKIRACELLLAFAERLPDEAKLDRVLPYVMPLLTDDSSDMVLVAALRTMTQLLALVHVTSPVNSFLFTQYIFPRLQTFVNTKGFKQNPIVRATYATCLASLSQTASRFLDVMQALRADGSLPAPDKASEDDANGHAATHDAYDATRLEVLDQFEGQTKVFLTDNDTSVRRAFLSSVTTLCVFFGESRASDLILSHLNTYLNDPDWQLKCAFFKTIVGVSVCIGGASLEEFILPLMLQALSDPQEFVIEQALRSLASMAEMGLLQRAKTWELIDTVARFELHPNLFIREAASHFVAASTTYLSLADVRILVAPLITPYLKVPVGSFSEADLLDALKKPVPRAVLDLALQWAGKVDNSAFWKQAREMRQLSSSSSSSMPPVSSVADLGPRSLARVPKTDEDEQWLGRLRNAGMRGEDEVKILAFREFLWRTGQRLKRDESATADPIYEQIISLTKLKITPQTVIFDNDVNTYNDHIRDLNSALHEATSESGSNDRRANGTSATEVEGSTDGQMNRTKPEKLRIPELKRQASGSGQSLSSSPGSGMGLLGSDFARARSSATGLLSGDELRNKAVAEVATDDVTAAGKLHTPVSRSRPGSSDDHAGPPGKRPGTAVDRRAAHNYAGNDPTVLRLLDAVYVDSFPTDAAEFGPLVQPLKPGMIYPSGNASGAGAWKPQGHLIGVLGEHSDRVNRIVVSPDHTFVATASDDGTIKIWDALRFERNVTHRSRATYRFGAGVRVTHLCFIDTTHTLVATGSDGSVRVVKVEVLDGQSGASFKVGKTLRDWTIPTKSASDNEFAVWCEHFRGDSASTLLLATNLGRILSVDLRDMSVMFVLHNPARHGTPTCFCLGRRHDWLLVGSANGVLDLWDLRFQLRLRSWAFPRACPITRLQLHPHRRNGRRQRVCVTGGTGHGETSVWDIEKLICHEVYRSAGSVPSQIQLQNYELQSLDDDRPEGQLERVAGAAAALASADDNTPAATAVSLCALYQLSPDDPDTQHAFILSGGPDARVRFWDPDRLDACKVLSGLSADQSPPTYSLGSLGLDTKVLSEKTSDPLEPGRSMSAGDVPESNGTRGNRSSSTTNNNNSSQRRPAPPRYESIRLASSRLIEGHLDSITDVALLERPFGIVLSADRSGQVFAYQ